jgi:hypothetical protein
MDIRTTSLNLNPIQGPGAHTQLQWAPLQTPVALPQLQWALVQTPAAIIRLQRVFYTDASGIASTAIGREIEAAGDYSVAIALNDQNGANVTQDNTMAIMGGKVGIGTLSPKSTLQVVGGYFQLPTTTGTHPSGDCDHSSEAGRVIVRTDGPPTLYVCTGAGGWETLA